MFLAGIFLILVFIFVLSRLKIMHEEILVGDEELAFTSEILEPYKPERSMTPLVTTPSMKDRSKSISFRRHRLCSAMDSEAFPDSFPKDRTYTVSLTGSVGLG